MKYQLILQWPFVDQSSEADYDALLEIEELLIENLEGGSEVDGHDAGSGEMNIFILTNDPRSTFERVQAILKSRRPWAKVRVAFREIGADQFTILWPQNLTEFSVT